MGFGKIILPLVLGFAAVVCVSAVFFLLPSFGADHLITGTVTGICVAYLGFLLYFFLMPRPKESGGSFFSSYLPGAVARYVVMVGAFCIVVFLLKIHTLGVLLGTFIGMMISTFISLNLMRRTPCKPPEA